MIKVITLMIFALDGTSPPAVVHFPSVRDCEAALAEAAPRLAETVSALCVESVLPVIPTRPRAGLAPNMDIQAR